jgi:hypothetical protein
MIMFRSIQPIAFKTFVKVFITIILLSVGYSNAATKAFVIKSLRRQSINPRYHIAIDYPIFTHGAAAKVINQVIKSEVNNRAKTMQKSFQDRGNGRYPSEFSANVEVLNHTHGRYSIIWLETAYFAGAAHPLTRSQILNYNAKLKQPLKLSNVVNITHGFYSCLSKLCRKSLHQQIEASGKSAMIDPQWFNRGTAANKKNFSIWSFTPQALQIYFPEYSIAPYAAGRFVVNIKHPEANCY